MGKTKILIVEYNPIVAEDRKTKLANLGYNVTATVYSREKALESVKKQIPDIAMIGISPGDGMNDVETASELKDIGARFGRTGVDSMHLVLNILGLGVIHHM